MRYRFGPFEVEPQKRELRKHGLRLRLQPQPFSILMCLLERAGELVTREELTRVLWGGATFVDYDLGLNGAIKKLRDRLGDSTEAPVYIETVPRQGYRFIAAVEANYPAPPVPPPAAVHVGSAGPDDAAPQSISDGNPVPAANLATRLRLRLPSPTALVIVSVLLAFSAGLTALRNRPPSPMPTPPPAANVSATITPRRVLVFVEPEAGGESLDTAVQAELQRQLSASLGFRVVSNESVAELLRMMRRSPRTGLDADTAREICLRDGTIDGLVRIAIAKTANGQALTASVLDAASGQVLASGNASAGWEHRAVAIQTLGESLRLRMAAAMWPPAAGRPRLEKVTTSSFRALELFSEAMKSVNARRLHPAIELLSDAVRLDPEFASAHIFLAHMYSNAFNRVDGAPHYKAALRLSSLVTENERYFIEGSYYHRFEMDLPRAARAYQALVSREPDNFWAANNLQNVYARMGLRQEGEALRQHVARLRPADFIFYYSAFFAAAISGQLNQAEEPRRRALSQITAASCEWNTDVCIQLHFFPAWRKFAELDRDGMLNEAHQLEGAFGSLGGRYRDAFAAALGDLYTLAGMPAQAREWIQRISDENLHAMILGDWNWQTADDAERRRQLALDARAGNSPGVAANLASYGMRADALRVLARAKSTAGKGGRFTPMWGETRMRLARAVLRAGAGDREAIAELNECLRSMRVNGDEYRFPAIVWFAGAQRSRGDIRGAIETLERFDEGHPGECVYWYWRVMRTAVWQQLAELYRRVGRVDDARAIEEKLASIRGSRVESTSLSH